VAQDFEMDPARVDTLADQIASATSDFGQDLQNVDDQVRNLLGSGWKAEPGSQFHDAFVDGHKGAGQVVEGMAQMVTTLHDAAASLRIADGQR
jgi:WXG100 family type VII secretion target